MTPFIADTPPDYLPAYKETLHTASSTLRPLSEHIRIIAPVNDLAEQGYKLKEPITFYIVPEEEYYVGFFKPLSIYCYGKTPLEVEKDLKADILDLYDHLKSTPNNKLGVAPKAWKKLLMEMIEDTNASKATI